MKQTGFSYPGKSETTFADKGISQQSKTVFTCRCTLVGAFDFDLVVGAKNHSKSSTIL